MKDYKIILISFVLLLFMIGAVSAADDNSDSNIVSDGPIIIIDPVIIDDPIIDPDDEGDDNPTNVEVTTKEIYVSDTGNDSNSGSNESPYATIRKAVSDVNASDDATIYIGEGTFFLDGYVEHQVIDWGDGDIEEWDEEYNCININLDHKTYGGNLKFIGAGADKTFLDGQSAYYFAEMGMDTNVIIKDVTFINCKNYVGGVIFSTGNLTIDGCEFKDCYSTGDYAGAIYTQGSSNYQFVNGMFMRVESPSTLTITNSKFISVYTTEGGSIGGAIYASQANLYLENNSFINTSVGANGMYGAAIYSGNSKSSIINNKFINVSGTNDGGLYLAPDNKESIVTGNEFINCSLTNDMFSIVNLANGNHIFENNTFTNSSNPIGNIYAQYARMNKLNFETTSDVINVTNVVVNKGVEIPFKITDDMGNIVKTYQYSIRISNDNNSYYIGNTPTNDGIKLTFSTVPDNGLYNLTVFYDGGNSVSDVLTTVNVMTSNDPVEVYVSPKGSDAQNGTEEFPVETIQHAIDLGFEKSFTVIVHLLKGTYSGDGNVELTISNKGNLKIIGEEYGEVIIDGNNANWFISASTTNVEMSNISFLNANTNNRNLISSDYNLYLKDCIVNNNTVNSNNYYVINNVLVDNLTYTDNYGRVYFGSSSNEITLSDSYFANNEFMDLNTGGILLISTKLTIENSKFISNVATMGGVICAYSQFTSKNNYYANNRATDVYYELSERTANCGVIYTEMGDYTFENDIFFNNSAKQNGVIGLELTGYSAESSPYYTFIGCEFISNSAVKAGVTTVKIGNFTDCKFINNTADYGGAMIVLLYTKPANSQSGVLGAQIIPTPVAETKTLELNNVTFEGNTAKYNGNDIYLAEKSNNYWGDDSQYAYALDLTLNFNDLNTSSLVDDLTANVIAPCGAQVGGSAISFLLDENKIGAAEIVNGVATLNYAGFEDGQYNLSGSINYQNNNVIVNNAIVNVKLEGILDNVTYWVAANGSDEEGNGSEANPFKTIEHAVNVASKNCRDITINITEGTYSGDLILSSMNNITLVGAGVGSTIIDGENTTTFATITEGKNIVTVSDLTIKNMLPDNRASKAIDAKVPLTIEEGANLLLRNVEMVDNHGGSVIIMNYGNLAIENSEFRRNGFSTNGLISGSNVTIDNSVFEDCYAQDRFISADNLIINNSEIKNIYNIRTSSVRFDLINIMSNSNGNIIIENSIISHDGSIEDLNDLGVTTDGKQVNPALNVNGNTYMVNSSMVNNYNGTLNTQDSVSSLTFVAPFGYTYVVPRNVTVCNSSFINYQYLWMATTNQVHNFVFDGCVFENLDYIAWIRTNVPDSNYNITNSVFLNCSNVINQNHYARMETPKHVNLNDNYWGNNSKPIVYFLDSGAIKDDVVEPETWITLYSEDLKTVIKNVTDGENSTEYTGNAPIRTDYADNNGALDYAVVFGPVGYLFTTDDDTNVIFNPEDAMYPFEAADPMNYRTPVFIEIEKITGTCAVFAGLSDMMGNPIANATIFYNVGDELLNATTDADGKFVALAGNGLVTLTFEGDDSYFPVNKSITLEGIAPVKNETEIDTTVNGDLVITNVLRDRCGNPLANKAITIFVNGTETNTTTNENGEFTFQGINNASFKIVYVGDISFQPASTVITLENIAPTRKATHIVVDAAFSRDANDYSAGERGGNHTGYLLDEDNNPVVNRTVQVAVNGPIYNITTDENGAFNLQINLAAANTYTYAIAFKGDDVYEASPLASSKLTLVAKSTSISASNKAFKSTAKTKKVVVTLKTIKNKYDGKMYLLKGKTLTLRVNGVTYSAKINANGQATFNIKLTKKGKFTAAIKFAGDKTYKASSKSITITIT